jgi:hypothetical protein
MELCRLRQEKIERTVLTRQMLDAKKNSATYNLIKGKLRSLLQECEQVDTSMKKKDDQSKGSSHSNHSDVLIVIN